MRTPQHEAETMGRRSAQDTGRVYLAAGSLFILVLLLSVGVVGWQLRAGALAEARGSIDQLSIALTEQTARSFQAVDVVLQDTANRLEATARSMGGDVGADMASREVHDLLRERVRAVPQTDALTLINSAGRAINTSRVYPPPNVDVSDRDYFRVFQGTGRTEAYISLPTHSRVSDAWTVYMARPLVVRSGESEFHGLIFGAVALDDIESFFRAVTTKPGSAVTLRRQDGVVLARFPHREDLIGQVERPDQRRGLLVAAHRLQSAPLEVEVSVSEDAALANWRRQTVVVGLFSLAAAVCMALMLRTIVRQFNTQRAARDALAARNAELEQVRTRLEAQTRQLGETAAALRSGERLLAERSETLNTTLENIDQGLMMVDARGNVAAYNHRAVDMLGLPDELLARRPAFREILQYQLDHGEFARNSPPMVSFVRSGGMLDRPQVYERERPDGRTIEVRSLPLQGGGMVRTYTDVSERKAAELKIRQAALFDELTGLVNRVCVQRHLDELLRAWPGGEGIIVLYFDLDRFRLINDARGHEVGDRLLIEAGRRIRSLARADDLVARIGGDEFALIRKAGPGEEDGATLACRLAERLAEPYVINGIRLGITVSIGVALGEPGVGTETLLRNADIALYRAKDAGGNGHRLYEPAMAAAQQEQFQLEQALRVALGNQEFQLAYQPVVALESNAVVGYEALLRWTDKTRGPVSPAQFVPVAEATGLIVPLGRWVLETACREAARWPGNCSIAVNLSPVQFRQGDLLEVVESCLSRSGLSPDRLELEVTEGVLLEESGAVLETMMGLRGAGVVITLDDFGTGHAGLSYLRRFPFDKIKIDRSFIRNLGQDQESEAIVEAILLLGRRLGLRVVAEGVEDEAQLEILRDMRCPLVQGFLTGRPMSAEMARAL